MHTAEGADRPKGRKYTRRVANEVNGYIRNHSKTIRNEKLRKTHKNNKEKEEK